MGEEGENTFFRTFLLAFGAWGFRVGWGRNKGSEWGTADSEAGQLTANLCSFPVLDAVPWAENGPFFQHFGARSFSWLIFRLGRPHEAHCLYIITKCEVKTNERCTAGLISWGGCLVPGLSRMARKHRHEDMLTQCLL